MTFHNLPSFVPSRPIILKISFLLLFLPSQPAQAQPNPPNGPNDGLSNQHSSTSMGVIVIVLIAALFFMGFFSIYIRHCSRYTSADGTIRRRTIAGSIARSRRASRGLDPAVIESFPIFDYAAVKNAQIGKGALECAVCLTEFEEDDTLRLIPRCDHVFHPECIDQWLAGHITCPVCRANLTEPGEWPNVQSPGTQNDTVLEVTQERLDDENDSNRNDNEESESMEQPLQGRMRRNFSTMRNVSVGRPRWMGKFSRSFSTGHVAVKQWENLDRFTLRLPEELRKQIVSGKLERTTSLVVLPRESSTRRGYRIGFGEGSSRGRSGSVRSDRAARSDRWTFSLIPPFITRAPSLKMNKVVNVTSTPTSRAGSLRGSIRGGSLRGSMQLDTTQLPV